LVPHIGAKGGGMARSARRVAREIGAEGARDRQQGNRESPHDLSL
jgi:hypothetical protein